MQSPIIIVGTQRSGTTWFGASMAHCPELAYWIEPRPVWVYGNWFRPDDLLTDADATPKIKRYIRRRFERFVERQGKQRLCEKTPSNCLRLRFVREVFPEAKILFILRDGRAVLRSTREQQAAGPSRERIWQRLLESPVREYPAYLSRIPDLAAKLLGRELKFWGARPPGWRGWTKHDSPYVVLAKQWAHTIRRASDDFQSLGPENKLLIRYENLVQNPESAWEEIQEFLQLDTPEPVLAEIRKTADPTRESKWLSELAPEILDEVRPHMEPMMKTLGYAW